jgi:ribonuclease HII
VFVDGRDRIDCGCDCEAVISGDALVTSIAAASIVAKVTRDRLMMRMGLATRATASSAIWATACRSTFHALNRLGPTDPSPPLVRAGRGILRRDRGRR